MLYYISDSFATDCRYLFPSMAAPTSEGSADNSSSIADEGRAALTQALLEVLTEHREHTSESGSEVSTFSDWTFRQQLAELHEQTNHEIGLLKALIQRLESFLQPEANRTALPADGIKTPNSIACRP